MNTSEQTPALPAAARLKNYLEVEPLAIEDPKESILAMLDCLKQYHADLDPESPEGELSRAALSGNTILGLLAFPDGHSLLWAVQADPPDINYQLSVAPTAEAFFSFAKTKHKYGMELSKSEAVALELFNVT